MCSYINALSHIPPVDVYFNTWMPVMDVIQLKIKDMYRVFFYVIINSCALRGLDVCVAAGTDLCVLVSVHDCVCAWLSMCVYRTEWKGERSRDGGSVDVDMKRGSETETRHSVDSVSTCLLGYLCHFISFLIPDFKAEPEQLETKCSTCSLLVFFTMRCVFPFICTRVLRPSTSVII